MWKIIENFSNYQISDKGQIRRGKKLIKSNSNGVGHLWVYLCKNGVVYKKYAHRLVLETYVGKCPEGMETRHLNGNPSDNRVDNLRWGTRKENCLDKMNSENNQKGSKHGMAKLTENLVLKIRKLYKNGWRPRDLGPKFGVTPQEISKIIHNRIWNHI